MKRLAIALLLTPLIAASAPAEPEAQPLEQALREARAEQASAEAETARLEQAASGAFPPTNDSADCSYCDCSPICRARQDGFKTTSPRAEWGKTNAGTLDVYQIMRALRGIGGSDEEQA